MDNDRLSVKSFASLASGCFILHCILEGWVGFLEWSQRGMIHEAKVFRGIHEPIFLYKLWKSIKEEPRLS
jgi:hypothetical protein